MTQEPKQETVAELKEMHRSMVTMMNNMMGMMNNIVAVSNSMMATQGDRMGNSRPGNGGGPIRKSMERYKSSPY
jgi:hypothetical protein